MRGEIQGRSPGIREKKKEAAFQKKAGFLFPVYRLVIQSFTVIQNFISGTRISEGRFLRELLRCPEQVEEHSR